MITVISKVSSFKEIESNLTGDGLSYVAFVDLREQATAFLTLLSRQAMQPSQVIIIEGFAKGEHLPGLSMPAGAPYIVSLFGLFPLAGLSLEGDLAGFFEKTHESAKMFSAD